MKWVAFEAALRRHNLQLVWINATGGAAPRGWAVRCGILEDGTAHAQVVLNGAVVHDPSFAIDDAAMVRVDGYLVVLVLIYPGVSGNA